MLIWLSDGEAGTTFGPDTMPVPGSPSASRLTSGALCDGGAGVVCGAAAFTAGAFSPACVPDAVAT